MPALLERRLPAALRPLWSLRADRRVSKADIIAVVFDFFQRC
jgi:hypothetical protein